MAKAQVTQQKSNELGGLPPELMVDGQVMGDVVKDVLPTAPVVDNSDDTGTGTDTGTDTYTDTDDLVTVVVLKGNSVQHDGELHKENTSFALDKEEAGRLIKLEVVANVAELRKQAIGQAGPTITVQDGVKVNRGP